MFFNDPLSVWNTFISSQLEVLSENTRYINDTKISKFLKLNPSLFKGFQGSLN